MSRTDHTKPRGGVPQDAWARLGRMSAADGNGGDCLTCNGTGRLRHPVTGKPGVQCPGCGGTGEAPEGDGQGAAARASRHVRFEGGRMKVLASSRGRTIPAPPEAPQSPGARLDSFPWAQSWSGFLAAIRDKSDSQGARAAIARVMEATRPLNANLSERVPAEGGFLVPERLRAQVLNYMQDSIIRPRCTVLTLDSERVPIPILDNPSQANGSQALAGLTFSFTEEGAAIPASVPNFGRVALEAWPDKALLQGVPNELLQDSPAFTDFFLPQVVARGLSWHVDDYVLYQGTGVGQPQALVNAPGAVAVTRSDPSGFHVSHLDVVTMLKNLHPQSKTTATWLASEDMFDQLLELNEIVGSAPSGQNITPPQTLKFNSDSGRWELLGLEIIANDHQPSAGTAGDLVLVDLDLLLLGERDAMTVEIGDQAAFATDTSHIRFRYRWDARYWMQESVTLANGKVVSPLVVLH